MDKITVNGKEIEIGSDGIQPLFDEELENTSGGLTIPRGTLVYQWVCRSCGCMSDWYDNSSDCIANLWAHILETNHALHEYHSKYLE